MSKAPSVHKFESATLRQLQRRAAANGRTLEVEMQAILRAALAAKAGPGFADLAAELRAKTAGRHHTPAEDLLPEARDAG